MSGEAFGLKLGDMELALELRLSAEPAQIMAINVSLHIMAINVLNAYSAKCRKACYIKYCMCA